MNDELESIEVSDEERLACTLFDDHVLEGEPDWQSVPTPDDDEEDVEPISNAVTPAMQSEARAAMRDDLEAVIAALMHALEAKDDAELYTRLASLDRDALTAAVMQGTALSEALIGALGSAFTDQLNIEAIADDTITQRILTA